MRRVRVHVSGHVQGVGFRFTTLDIAAHHPGVTGYVRNLPNGGVEIVAEGPQRSLEHFLEDVQEAMSGYISDFSIADEQPTGDFGGFAIVR